MAQKKMKLKEFKEAMEKAGFPFEIWGYEDILNMISILQKYQADEEEKLGCMAAAKASKARKKILFDILNERGYFDDVK